MIPWQAIYVGLGIVFIWIVSIPHRAGRAREPVSGALWMLAAILWPVCLLFVIAKIVWFVIEDVRIRKP